MASHDLLKEYGNLFKSFNYLIAKNYDGSNSRISNVVMWLTDAIMACAFVAVISAKSAEFGFRQYFCVYFRKRPLGNVWIRLFTTIPSYGLNNIRSSLSLIDNQSKKRTPLNLEPVGCQAGTPPCKSQLPQKPEQQQPVTLFSTEGCLAQRWRKN